MGYSINSIKSAITIGLEYTSYNNFNRKTLDFKILKWEKNDCVQPTWIQKSAIISLKFIKIDRNMSAMLKGNQLNSCMFIMRL